MTPASKDILHKTLRGRRHKAFTNDQQVTSSELVNAGLLRRTASGGVELSDDVRFSILLERHQPAETAGCASATATVSAAKR